MIIIDHISLIKSEPMLKAKYIKIQSILNLYRHRNRRLVKIKKIFSE